jgi:hypothetical protein
MFIKIYHKTSSIINFNCQLVVQLASLIEGKKDISLNQKD